jgi:pheromone shutdown protein TraB
MLTEARSEEAKKIRREMMKQGKDWSPRRGKVLVPRKDHLANTLTTIKEDVNRLVLVIPKSIDMQIQSTKDTLKDIKIMETQERLAQENWRILISWLEDSLAKTSQ